MTLADFLLQRIAEDEAAAREEWPNVRGPHLTTCMLVAPEHLYIGDPCCDCGYPARVLAECEAKRWMVGAHTWHGPRGRESYGPDHEEALRVLAAIYADHEDYDASWKP